MTVATNGGETKDIRASDSNNATSAADVVRRDFSSDMTQCSQRVDLRRSLLKLSLARSSSKTDATNGDDSDDSVKYRKKFSVPTSQWPWLTRVGSELWNQDSFDPFQIFEVTHKCCLVLEVTVVRGEKVTKGWLADMVDTPDPYVILHVPGTPNGRKRTRQVDNCINPEWDEKFTFFLDPEKRNTLVVTLMDANYTVDELLGTENVNLGDINFGEDASIPVTFNNTSKVHLKLKLAKDTNPDLRYSLALCEEEKTFLRQRRVKVLSAMQRILGDRGPKDIRQVPVVAVLGSGGGFRALTAFSGVFKALYDTGLLDCAFYTAGLSGSAWFLSTVYSHPGFPDGDYKEIQAEIRSCIGNYWVKNLTPTGMYRYGSTLMQKSMSGQPVSFTDFFGCLIGDTLLPGRQKTTLTDVRKVLVGGHAPMPLFTCLHVKKNVSARVFQEWIEFSPYEIGIAKYGAFMKPEHFGSKFFLGRLVRQYQESPLHYLQGVWGSAFCILFRRLVTDTGKKDLAELLRDKAKEDEREEEEELRRMEERAQDMTEDESSSEDDVESHSSDNESVEEGDSSRSSKPRMSSVDLGKPQARHAAPTKSASQDELDGDAVVSTARHPRLVRKLAVSLNPASEESTKNGTQHPRGLGRSCSYWKDRRRTRRETKREKKSGFLKSLVDSVFSSNFLNTRAGRAGLIFNPLRGLSLSHMYPLSPFSPTTPSDETDYKGQHEALDPEAKKLYVVDGGLTFNSPYPLVLRPQRGVDVFLSFDFSARPTDDTPPFKELLLAEQWSKVNNVPFPPIEEQAAKFAREPPRECYVFRHPTDVYCPVILHFAIVNNEYKRYKSPGVKRTEEEEKEADFPIFNDPRNPYSLFNFYYTAEQFDKLAGLMEFNTLLNVELIKDEMAKAVKRKQELCEHRPFSLRSIVRLKLRLRGREAARKLRDYIKANKSQDSTDDDDSDDEYFDALNCDDELES